MQGDDEVQLELQRLQSGQGGTESDSINIERRRKKYAEYLVQMAALDTMSRAAKVFTDYLL